MQKNSIKASILIWAIFLSLIISITFIQISTKINKNLNNNTNRINNVKTNLEVKNKLNNAIINSNFSENTLNNWDKIVFDKTTELIIWLKQDETNISKINIPSTITITIINWWAIKYKNNSLSWVINTTKSFNATVWDLLISNLWWNSKVKINSNKNENFLWKYLNYKIVKEIWNKEVIKSYFKIKNF